MSSSSSCLIPKKYYKLYGSMSSTIMPPSSKSSSISSFSFSSSSLSYAGLGLKLETSMVVKKLKKDLFFTSFTVTLDCPVFLFFCFFFIYFKVKFLPTHSIGLA